MVLSTFLSWAYSVLKVEGCLFKVPRIHFEQQSEIFRTMFSLPLGILGELDGMNDHQPLHLEGIKRREFKLFLKILLGVPQSVYLFLE